MMGERSMSREGQAKRSEVIKEEIIATALEIGIEEGFDLLTVRKISERMDYTTGVIYHHFKDKQEIIDRIQRDANLEMKGRIEAVINYEDGFFENSKRIFHMIMELAFTEKERYNLIVLDKYSKKRSESASQWLNMLGTSLEMGIRSGEVKEVDVRKTAFCIWTSFLGFNLIISKSEGMKKEEAEELFETQISLIFDNLRK